MTYFFEVANTAAIAQYTVVKLQEEKICGVDDLELVDKYFIKQLIDNLKLPCGQINVGGAMIVAPDFYSGAKSQMILEAASNIVQFYKTVGRAITNTVMQLDPIIKDYKKECYILVKRKVEYVSDVPNIIKALLIIKWEESFSNFLHRNVGERKIQLSYVI